MLGVVGLGAVMVVRRCGGRRDAMAAGRMAAGWARA